MDPNFCQCQWIFTQYKSKQTNKTLLLKFILQHQINTERQSSTTNGYISYMATPLIKVVVMCSLNAFIESLIKGLVRKLILPFAKCFRTAVVLSFSIIVALFPHGILSASPSLPTLPKKKCYPNMCVCLPSKMSQQISVQRQNSSWTG